MSGDEQVGTYDLRLGTLSAGSNYTMTPAGNQQLTVTQKPLTNDGTNTLASYIGINYPSYLSVENGSSYTAKDLNPSQALYWAPKLGQTAIAYTMSVTDVTDGGNTPVAESDPLSSGRTYQVTLTGTGNYTGTYTYQVQTVDAEYFINLGQGATLTYNRTGHEVTLTPYLTSGSLPADLQWRVTGSTLSGKPLPQGTYQGGNYSITLTEAGTYTIVVTAQDSQDKGYFGTVTCVVQPKNIGENDVTVNTPEGDFGWTGGEVRPENEDRLLAYAGSDVPRREDGTTNYILSYSNNINPGQASVLITGVGNYTGSRSVKYTIGETRYQVSYDLNGAAGTPPADPAFYEPGDTVTVMSLPEGVTGQPENTIFLGWSTAAITEPVTAAEQLDTWYQAGSGFEMDKKNVTLYAIWATDKNGNGRPDYAEDQYSVTYAPGTGATGTPPSDNGLYMAGDTVTIKHEGVTMAREGYTLLGWTLQEPSDSTHTIGTMEAYQAFIRQYSMYPPAAGATFTMPASDVTLYAVWATDTNQNGTADWMENNQIFVYYDANGGADSIAPEIISASETGVPYKVQGNGESLKKPNAVLVGWTMKQPYSGFVTSASQLNPDDCSFTPEYGTTYHYHAFGTSHTIKTTDGQMVVFYALWAEDINGNGQPDYEEQKYTVLYQNAASDVTASPMPTDSKQYLSGQSAMAEAFDGTATYGDNRTALFLGWTTAETAARTLYTRENPLPEDVPVYQAGELVPVAGNVTLYPLWAEEDYHTASYTITASVLGGHGTADASPATVLEGGRATVTITPDKGYRLGAVLINGRSHDITGMTPDKQGVYTLTPDNIQENQVVVVSFSRGSFTVEQPQEKTYNGASLKPELVVKDGGKTLVENTDYTVAWTKNGLPVSQLIDAGSYVAQVTGQPGTAYEGVVQVVYFTIGPKDLANPGISVTGISDQKYTGQPVSLSITVTDAEIGSGTPLVEGRDYTVSYQTDSGSTSSIAPSEEGRYTVRLTGTGNYTGSVTEEFQITRDVVTIVPQEDQGKTFGANDPAEYSYKAYLHYGTADQVETSVTGHLTRAPGENASTYAYDVSGLSAGSASVVLADDADRFTIRPKSLAEDDAADGTQPVAVTPIPDQVYDGTEKTPVPVVTYTPATGGTLALTQGQDFTLSYYRQDDPDKTAITPQEVGSYVAVLTAATGNYTGTREVPFAITEASGGLTITPSHTEAVYDRQNQKPSLTVLFRGTPLDTANYTAVYSYNGGPEQALTDETVFVDAGTYQITVTAENGYTGSAQATVVIRPAEITSVTLSETSFSYDGTAKAPAVTAVQADGLTLETGEYTADIPQNAIAAGRYTVTVTANNPNFTGSAQAFFTISTGNSLTVSALSDHVYDGAPYQPKPEVRDGSTLLTEGRDYTLAYQGTSNIPLAVGTYEAMVSGAGSYAGKTGTASFAITAKNIANTQIGSGKVTVLVDDAVYDGTGKKPAVVVTYTTQDGRVLFLTENADYTLDYENNTAAGQGKVTIAGMGNYTGQLTKSFTIFPDAGSNLSVAVQPQHLPYNGTEQEPTVTVQDGTTPLVQGRDYTVSYLPQSGTGAQLGSNGKPLHAGIYTVQIQGTSNYDGYSGSAAFVITPAGMTGGTISVSGTYTYNGSAQTPSNGNVTVTVNGKALTPGTDYELAYANNVTAGSYAVVTAIGKGDYSGALNGTFVIGKAMLTITPVDTSKTYGEADDELHYTHTGGSDVHFSGTLSRKAGETVGSYAINLGTLTETSGNYVLQLSGSPVFTIGAKDIAQVDGASQLQENGLAAGYLESGWNGLLSLVYQAELGGLALVKDTDYQLTFTADDGTGTPVETQPVAAGTYTGSGQLQWQLHLHADHRFCVSGSPDRGRRRCHL